MPLLVSSQTPSSDSLCCVPCIALKKALLVKTEYDYTKTQLDIARDSIFFLNKIVSKQNSVISTQDSSISLYKRNEMDFSNIIKNKNTEINLFEKEVKKQKKHKLIAYGVSVVSIILGTLIAL